MTSPTGASAGTKTVPSPAAEGSPAEHPRRTRLPDRRRGRHARHGAAARARREGRALRRRPPRASSTSPTRSPCATAWPTSPPGSRRARAACCSTPPPTPTSRRAEDDAELAYLVNEHGPALLARAAREQGLAFVHVSTDFVFDGRKEGAYTETDDDQPALGLRRLQARGRSSPSSRSTRKRSSCARPGSSDRAASNFPVKILAAARTRPSLSVVTDEVGSPTYTLDLAAGLLGLVEAGASGLYHLAGSGSCSRFELAGDVTRARRAGRRSRSSRSPATRFP